MSRAKNLKKLLQVGEDNDFNCTNEAISNDLAERTIHGISQLDTDVINLFLSKKLNIIAALLHAKASLGLIGMGNNKRVGYDEATKWARQKVGPKAYDAIQELSDSIEIDQGGLHIPKMTKIRGIHY